MSRKTIFLITVFVMVLLFGLTRLLPVERVQAQCSTPSSCKTCHETQGQNPPDDSKIWHSDHITQDFCSACHGGNRDAADALTAHSGMTSQLEQMAPSCRNCHATDFAAQFQTYAAELGISDTSAYTGAAPETLPLNTVSLATVAPTSIPTPTPYCPPPNNTLNFILGAVLFAGVTGGGTYIVWNERRRHKLEPTSASLIKWLFSGLRREQWSPYTAGVLLGIAGILVVVLANRILSASGPVAIITSTLVNWAAPVFAKANMYFTYVIPPGLSFPVVLLIGVFFGGMIGALTSRTWRLRWNDDPTWRKVLGPQAWKRIVIGFVGAVILQYGASIAGGCTSGLAISGGMLLAPAAFLFMGGMFISGIIVALIVYRRRY
jgi:uncharacterized protein